MKKHRKITALLIVAVMVLGLFSACGQKSPTNTTDLSESVKPNSSTDPADTKDKETPPEGQYTIANPPVTYKVMRAQHEMQPIDKSSSVFKEIARITGITIDIEGVPTGYDDKLKVMLGSDTIPDIVICGSADANKYGPLGAFIPISDYFDEMSNLKERMEDSGEVPKTYAPDGKLYLLPMFKRNDIVEADVPCIRYDVVKELGMELPKNFDDLRDILIAIKEKYPDSYPWTSRGAGGLFEYISYSLGSGNGMYYDKDVEGGKWLYAPAHDEYETVLEYLSDLYAKRLIDPDYTVGNTQSLLEKITSEKSYFYWDGGSFTLNMNSVLQESNPDALISPLPNCLTNYIGQTRGQRNKLHVLNEGYSVSAKVKNPEYIIKLFDWMYSDEGADITNFGEEGVDWDRNDEGNPVPNPQLVEQYKDANDPWRAYMGHLGAGLLGFSVYLDLYNHLPFMDEEAIEIAELMAGNPNLDIFPLNPVFTEEENQKRADIDASLGTLVDQYREKILIGELPVSEFKALQKKLIDTGAYELEEMYNDAEARTK